MGIHTSTKCQAVGFTLVALLPACKVCLIQLHMGMHISTQYQAEGFTLVAFLSPYKLFSLFYCFTPGYHHLFQWHAFKLIVVESYIHYPRISGLWMPRTNSLMWMDAHDQSLYLDVPLIWLSILFYWIPTSDVDAQGHPIFSFSLPLHVTAQYWGEGGGGNTIRFLRGVPPYICTNLEVALWIKSGLLKSETDATLDLFFPFISFAVFNTSNYL